MDLAILFPSTSTLIPTANFSFLPSKIFSVGDEDVLCEDGVVDL